VLLCLGGGGGREVRWGWFLVQMSVHFTAKQTKETAQQPVEQRNDKNATK
jgi:hypothetical protein